MAKSIKGRLVQRAQSIANATGTPRWVRFTSMGWRIERAPPPDDPPDAALFVRLDPKEPTNA